MGDGGTGIRQEAGRVSGGAAVLLLALGVAPFLAGCWGIGTTVHEAKVIEESETQLAAIRPGQTTRAETLALLGPPWLSSRHWRFDLYRVTDYDREVGVVFFLYLPVAPGGGRTDWEGYALITWDDDDVVAALATGKVDRNAYMERGQLILRAGELALATYPADLIKEHGLVLWARHHRRDGYLKERAEGNACTVVLACDRGELCPDQVTIDDGPPFDPGFPKLYCTSEDACADAEPDPAASREANRPVSRMPLLHPLELPSGEHRMGLVDRLRPGSTDTTFSCLPGQVLFARIRAEVVGKSFWRGVRLQPAVQWVDVLPQDWLDYGVVVWRGGRWFAAP